MKCPKRPVTRNACSQAENNSQPVSFKSTMKSQNKSVKGQRKALADKTNSGLDENSTKESVNLIMTNEASPESNRDPLNDDFSTLKRPKRTHRLPSKFEDHAMLPRHFTSLARSNTSSKPIKETKSKLSPVFELKQNKKFTLEPPNSDTNNNPQSEINRLSKNEVFRIICGETQPREISVKQKPIERKELPKKFGSKLFKLMNTSEEQQEKKQKCDLADGNKLDIYEFDFDPLEEPQIKKVKKKRKYTKRKKFDQFFYPKGSTYNIKIAKTVESLKDLMSAKKISTEEVTEFVGNHSKKDVSTSDIHLNRDDEFEFEDNIEHADPQNLDLEVNNDIVANTETMSEPNKLVNKNISNRSDLSFFDDVPVAHSSFNTTNLNNKPMGSPWRVELPTDQRKWPVNFYVKPSMTPAYDSTFQHVSLDRNSTNTPQNPGRKGKYMNEVCDPALFESNIEKLKQTSILSFFEDVVSKSAEKLKKVSFSVVTPQKNNSNSLFQEANNTALQSVTKSIFNTPPKQLSRPLSENSRVALCELNVNSPVRTQTATIDIESRMSLSSPATSPAASPEKGIKKKSKKKNKKEKENYYGFESDDQENVSPNVNVNRRRVYGLNAREQHKQRRLQKLPTRMDSVPFKLRNRQLLQEEINNVPLNEETESTITAKFKTATKDQLNTEKASTEVQPADVEDVVEQLVESGSPDHVVCLFEDYLPDVSNNVNLKQYGRARQSLVRRKRKVSASSSDENSAITEEVEEPALFTVKPRRTVKRKKKKVKAKEEDKEVDAWAASFNSMLEEVDEFPLVVE